MAGEPMFDGGDYELVRDFLDHMGLARNGPYMGYISRGWGWMLPHWVLHAIVWTWNQVACWRYGHECLGLLYEGDSVIEDWVCFHCNRDTRVLP